MKGRDRDSRKERREKIIEGGNMTLVIIQYMYIYRTYAFTCMVYTVVSSSPTRGSYIIFLKNTELGKLCYVAFLSF